MANPEPIRTRDLLDQTSLIQDPDDKMLLIMDTLKETGCCSRSGKVLHIHLQNKDTKNSL